MANEVRFLKGSQSGYEALTTKDPNTFYFTETNLYLGTIKLTNNSDITGILTRLTQVETDVDNVETSIGTLSTLTTEEKSSLVAAINEIVTKMTNNTNASKVTIKEDATNPLYSKVYTIKQGTTEVGTINIPKDMVVKSGEVLTNPDDEHTGTFIVLTLANATSDKIFINVGTLVDIYKAAAGATQVQLAIDSSTRKISATIVAGSITATELAANAVTTEKILDGSVTVAKLHADVNALLNKADSAVQEVTEGDTNGTILVDGTSVNVHGLGTAAYAATGDFDPDGSASQALADAKVYVNNLLTWNGF